MDQTSSNQSIRPAVSPLRAVLIGQLVVNVPVIAIIMVAFFTGGIVFPQQPGISLIAGVILGWAWWSLSVRRWRAWALSKGISPAELTAWHLSLVWPGRAIGIHRTTKMTSHPTGINP